MKAQIKSSTIKNLLVMILPLLFLIARAFGLDIVPEEEKEFSNTLLVLVDQLADVIATIIIIITYIGTWIGRKKASEPLGGFFKDNK